VYRNGIFLTGGACVAGHLAQKISDSTGLKVNIGEEPIACVVKGLSTIIRDDRYASLAYSLENDK